MSTLFANAAAVSRSWYVAARSRDVRRGGIVRFTLGPRAIAVFRDRDGRAHAIDARCPHLGADLTQGRVDGDAIECAFHHWTFGADGACRRAPGHDAPPARQARAYPVVERWGCVWLFNGPAPLFELPAPADDVRWRTVALRPQRVNCHPHVVLANGLDVTHYETLHGMTLTSPAACSQPTPYSVQIDLRGRPQSAMWRAICGTRGGDLIARFTAIGGSLAWASVLAPMRLHVLFTGAPDADGRCVTRTIAFLAGRPGPAWLRAAGLMAMLLHDDRRILDRLDFRPAFADTDAPMRALAGVVDRLGSW